MRKASIGSILRRSSAKSRYAIRHEIDPWQVYINERLQSQSPNSSYDLKIFRKHKNTMKLSPLVCFALSLGVSAHVSHSYIFISH